MQPARPYRIGHISDPHISRQHYREHIKSFKLLLRAMLNDGVDHIVISGDIISTGNEDDYFLTREILFSHGLLNSSRLSVIPGNHDIFGGPHRAVDVLSFPQHIRSVDYRRNMQLFQNAFAETFEGVVHLHPTDVFPYVKKVGPFNIVGINSIPPWSFRKNILGTNGMIDEQQYEALASPDAIQILEGRTTIVIMHHHFNDIVQSDYDAGNMWTRIESKTMRLRKRKKIIRLFETLNVRYVLHGHLHRNELYERNGILFANGAGAICDDPVPFLKYNLLEYSEEYCRMKICQLPIPYQVSTVTQALHRKHKPLGMPVYSLQQVNTR